MFAYLKTVFSARYVSGATNERSGVMVVVPTAEIFETVGRTARRRGSLLPRAIRKLTTALELSV